MVRNPSLKLRRGLFSAATALLSVNTGLVAANLFVGRSNPLQFTLAHGAIFVLGAAASAGLMIWLLREGVGRDRLLDPVLASLPGTPLLAAWLLIYLRDDLNAAIADSFSLRALLGLSLLILPAAGVALWERRQQKHLLVSIGGHVQRRISESLLALAAAGGIWDLIVKATFGDLLGSWIWLGVIPVWFAILLGIVRQPPVGPTRPWLRGLGLAVLTAPIGFSIATQFESPIRHLIVTSGGARILALLLLSLTAYMAWLLIKLSSEPGGERISVTLGRHRSAAILISLMGVGLLQAASYVAVTMDDLGRYWTAADFLQNGIGYPVWAGDEGTAQAGSGEPWVDPPVFPLMILGGFAAAGHYFHSAQIPTFVANLFLPAAIYLSARTLAAGRSVAFIAASLTVLFPPFQIHTLGASEPDSVFVLELALGVLFLARASRADAGTPDKLALGFVAGLMTLTRPEGLIYAGAFTLALPIMRRDLRSWLSPSIAAAAVISFTLFIAAATDAFWPARSSGLSPDNIGANLNSLVLVAWPYYVRVLLMDDLRAVLLVAMFTITLILGVARLARSNRAMLAVPAALAINVAAALALNPFALRSSEPTEYFRHLSYGLPLLALLSAVGVDWVLRALKGRGAVFKAALWALALALIFGELYLLATPEEFYHGNTAGSLLRGGDIYVQALDLVRYPIELPCDVCEPVLGGGFEGFRPRLFDHYGVYDMHSNTVGISYQAISAVLVFVGAVAAAVSRRRLKRLATSLSGDPRRAVSAP